MTVTVTVHVSTGRSLRSAPSAVADRRYREEHVPTVEARSDLRPGMLERLRFKQADEPYAGGMPRRARDAIFPACRAWITSPCPLPDRFPPARCGTGRGADAGLVPATGAHMRWRR